jgi:hypothetical protein
MTPHQIELVKKLDQEVKNLSILMQHTEIGDSLTIKDIRHYLYLLNKEVKESDLQYEIKTEIYNLFENLGAKSDILSTIGSYKETQSDEAVLLQLEQLNSIYGNTYMPNLLVKELSERIAIHQDCAEKTNEALSNLPSVKDLNKPKP